jgi:hypothetical protein
MQQLERTESRTYSNWNSELPKNLLRHVKRLEHSRLPSMALEHTPKANAAWINQKQDGAINRISKLASHSPGPRCPTPVYGHFDDYRRTGSYLYSFTTVKLIFHVFYGLCLAGQIWPVVHHLNDSFLTVKQWCCRVCSESNALCKPGNGLNSFQCSTIEAEANYMASDSPRSLQGWLPAVSFRVKNVKRNN